MTVVDFAGGVAVVAGDAGAVTVISASDSPVLSEMDCVGAAGAIDSASTDIYNSVTIMVCKIRRVGIIIRGVGLICFTKYEGTYYTEI